MDTFEITTQYVSGMANEEIREEGLYHRQYPDRYENVEKIFGEKKNPDEKVDDIFADILMQIPRGKSREKMCEETLGSDEVWKSFYQSRR